MSDLIQSLFLSPVLVFIVMTSMLIFVTAWAFRLKEYPGYLLGWLTGIFFIIIYESLTGMNQQPPPETTEPAAEASLTFFQVLLPAIMGLVMGIGILMLLNSFIDSHIRRSISIAVLTATLVVVLFFLVAISGIATRMIGIFALAFAIGVLAVIVITGTPRRHISGPPTGSGSAGGRGDIPEARLDEARSRFDNVRRRIQRPYE